jgi:transcriptional regulator with XRE-family HTH domain
LGRTKRQSSLPVQFGLRLKQLRLAHGLTQERLAELSGISVDFLSLIERGRNSPSFQNLSELSVALKVDVGELFAFGKGRKP